MTEQQRYIWRRTVMNGYEPDNQVTFIGVPDPEVEGGLIAIECFALAYFRDGPCDCGVKQIGPEQFAWWNDDQRGTEQSFGAAFDELPALITVPDHYEDRDAEPLVRIELRPNGRIEWVTAELAEMHREMIEHAALDMGPKEGGTYDQ
jgi:hypothetical protein